MSQAIHKKKKKKSHSIKVAMVGDPQIGKTSLMVKYVEGVNFMEKTIELKNAEITFSIWDLGGQREYMEMMPLVCNEATALLFMFDLSRPATLASVRQWYMEARKLNKEIYSHVHDIYYIQRAIPFLIGTKFDYFSQMQLSHKQEMTKQARKFAKAMKASLIFSSAQHGINVAKIFKIVLAKAFRLKCNIKPITKVGEPILEY
eukprot:551355-Amorphochlora_amoeboformis.AAC.1